MQIGQKETIKILIVYTNNGETHLNSSYLFVLSVEMYLAPVWTQPEPLVQP